MVLFRSVPGESVDLGSRLLFLYHVTCVFSRSTLLCQFSVLPCLLDVGLV